jgi:hypothetical protein
MQKILVIASLHVSDEVTPDQIDYAMSMLECVLEEPYLNEDEDQPEKVGAEFFLRTYTGEAVSLIEGALSVGIEGAPEDDYAETVLTEVWEDLQKLAALNAHKTETFVFNAPPLLVPWTTSVLAWEATGVEIVEASYLIKRPGYEPQGEPQVRVTVTGTAREIARFKAVHVDAS